MSEHYHRVKREHHSDNTNKNINQFGHMRLFLSRRSRERAQSSTNKNTDDLNVSEHYRRMRRECRTQSYHVETDTGMDPHNNITEHQEHILTPAPHQTAGFDMGDVEIDVPAACSPPGSGIEINVQEPSATPGP